MRVGWATWLLSATLAGCDIDLERMLEQPKYDPYEANPYFSNGTTMQDPPEGTVAVDELLAPETWVTGLREGEPVARIPAPVSAQVLARGRQRYGIFCGPCHGLNGDGDTQVAENMRLRPPPSLIGQPVRSYQPGRIYRAIAEGYGLMRSYATELDVGDRWAVVAYVQVLQLSQRAELSKLPPAIQREAAPWL